MRNYFPKSHPNIIIFIEFWGSIMLLAQSCKNIAQIINVYHCEFRLMHTKNHKTSRTITYATYHASTNSTVIFESSFLQSVVTTSQTLT